MKTDTRCVADGNLGRTRDSYVQELVAEISMYSGYPSGWMGSLDNQQAHNTGPGISFAHPTENERSGRLKIETAGTNNLNRHPVIW